MLRIVIAEDEPRVAELICQLGHWKEHGIRISGIYYDGEMALKGLQEQKPDIVITDIRMPGIDGLELIRRARDAGIHTEFIILSGYRHFEYAKTAIQQGVVDYLLKPIDEEALNGTLKKVCRKIKNEKKNIIRLKHSRYAENMWRQIIPSADDSAKRQWEREAVSTEEVNKVYFTRFVPGLFHACYVRTTVDSTLQNSSVFQENIHEVIEKTERKGLYAESYFSDDEGIFFLLNLKHSMFDIEKQCISALYYEIKNLSEIYGPFEVTVGCSQYSEDVAALPRLLYEARLTERGRLIYGGDKILDYRMLQKLKRFEAYEIITPFRVSDIQRCFDHLLMDELKSIYCDIIEAAHKYVGYHPLDLLEVQRELIRLSLERFIVNEAERKKFTHTIIVDTSTANSFAVLLEETVKRLMEHFNHYVQQMREKQIRPVESAKNYICSSYMNNISLELVAERVGLSATYLSKIFKQETGMGFAEYLTEARINAARNMLAESRKSVKAIAADVGYEDEKYFSKVFKKVVGIKPSAYRNLYS